MAKQIKAVEEQIKRIEKASTKAEEEEEILRKLKKEDKEMKVKVRKETEISTKT